MHSKKIKVAISHGDINGIGYEILLKAFADERLLDLFVPIIYGSIEAEQAWRGLLEVEAPSWTPIASASEATEAKVYIVDCVPKGIPLMVGQASELAGAGALLALERALGEVQAGKADLLVTAPINKSAMPREHFPYSGHTPFLEQRAALIEGESLMLLVGGDCRVALATEHIPVSEVARALSPELIARKVRLLIAGLIKDFGVVKPRIAVLALNPHSGDGGLIGKEEETIIRPAIEQLNQEGHIVFGPYAADGFWQSGQAESFDAILAMYHDQGLAPFKALYMHEGVNTTLGLNIIRTSPDHGTGYDIAGKGLASPDSLRSAIYQGIDMYRARAAHAQATRNPLRRLYHNRGRDDERLDHLTEED